MQPGDKDVTVVTCFSIYGVAMSTYGLFETIQLIHQLLTVKTKAVKSIRILTMLATIIATIDMYGLTYWSVSIYFYIYGTHREIGMIFRTAYIFSLLSIVTIASVRIYISLSATAYQYKTITYIIFWTFYILSLIFGLLSTFGQFIWHYPEVALCSAISIMFYVFTTFHLIILFIGALKNIANKLDGKSQLKQKAQLFKVITKYTILVIIPSLVSFCVALAILPFALTNDFVSTSHTILFGIILIDLLVNIISLSLQFEFNEKKYFKLCGKCHNKAVETFLNVNNNNDIILNVQIKKMVSGPAIRMEIMADSMINTPDHRTDIVINDSNITHQ